MTDFKCLNNLIEQLRQIEKKKIKILFELFDSLPQLLTNDIHIFFALKNTLFYLFIPLTV